MPTIAETMSAAASEAMKLTRKYFVVELDFSDQSVRQLEKLFGDVDFSMPGGRSEKNMETLTRVWGSYFGEVIRRNLGGIWNESPSDGRAATMDVNGRTIEPHSAVKLQLTGSHEIGIGELYQQLLGTK